jgi:hypothetical protein
MFKLLYDDICFDLLAKEQAPSFFLYSFIYSEASRAKVKKNFYQINMKYVKLETITADISF